MDDPAIVRAAQGGDAIAMARLMDAVAPFVGRICGPIALEHAADAAQEALIQVFRDLRQLRDPARLRPWVRRIASREAVRHAQRARRAAALGRDEQAPLPEPDDPGLRRDVARVLEGLAPSQRAILVLRDLEGLSEEEAADQLGVARGTVKSRLHRARAAFAKEWDA